VASYESQQTDTWGTIWASEIITVYAADNINSFALTAAGNFSSTSRSQPYYNQSQLQSTDPALVSKLPESRQADLTSSPWTAESGYYSTDYRITRDAFITKFQDVVNNSRIDFGSKWNLTCFSKVLATDLRTIVFQLSDAEENIDQFCKDQVTGSMFDVDLDPIIQIS
jgi:hypothetical protein